MASLPKREARRVGFSDAAYARASDPRRRMATKAFNKERELEVPRGIVVNPPRPASHSSIPGPQFVPALYIGNPRTQVTVPRMVRATNRTGKQSSQSERLKGASNTRRSSSSDSDDPNERTPLLRPNESSGPDRRRATSVQSETSERPICACLYFGCTLS